MDSLAGKIYQNTGLPSFTPYVQSDKTLINKAKFNLYSLLMPVHDEEMAIQEFKFPVLKWGELIAQNPKI